MQHREFFTFLSGVYQIRNTENNYIYIGSSGTLYDRLKSHYNSLTNNKNVAKLQSDWNVYDDDKPFVFEVLKIFDIDKIDREYLYNLEQIYIDEYRPFYNTYAKSEIKKKYKYDKKRNENISMTKEVEIQKYICLKYIEDYPNDMLEVDFQFKPNKMTTYVHNKLMRLFSIFPDFYQSVIDYVLPFQADIKDKLQIIGRTCYLIGDGFPVFKIRGINNDKSKLTFDIDYVYVNKYMNKHKISAYEVFKLIFTDSDKIDPWFRLKTETSKQRLNKKGSC